jgi:putative restriction endonuclease
MKKNPLQSLRLQRQFPYENNLGGTMIGGAGRPRAWLLLTFGDDRQYAGNAGYDDNPAEFYSYDSYVPNHRRVAAGEQAIVCDKERALGIASIERIDEEPSTRLLQRCPVCGITGCKQRKTMHPKYRCNKGHEFDEPVRETVSCTKYTAHFGPFTPFTEAFGRDFLRQGCPRYNDQLAMQEFDFSLMEAAFRNAYPVAAAAIGVALSGSYISAAAGDENGSASPEAYSPTGVDGRQRVLRQICARRGQQAFRDELRSRYGDQCLVSGCKVLHVLEAAHIQPYRGESDNHPENGLLLRADLHTLFDLDLMGIEPSTLSVQFHGAVKLGEYAELHGRRLLCSQRRPSEEALTARWLLFQNRANEGVT